jgi:hypothetical protein
VDIESDIVVDVHWVLLFEVSEPAAFSNPRMSLEESIGLALVLLYWIFEWLLVFGYTGCT